MNLLVNWFYRFRVFLTNVALMILKAPRPLLFTGPGSSLQLCHTIAQMGTSRLLVVTDAVLMKLGIVDPILKALREEGVECFVYDGVEPDPTYAQVEAGGLVRPRHGVARLLVKSSEGDCEPEPILVVKVRFERIPRP